MATVTIDDKNLNDIANAIRNKNETTTRYKPGEMATAINQINTDGDTTTEDALASGEITTYTNTRITKLIGGCFSHNQKLISVSLPSVTTIEGLYNFYGSYNLTYINLPELQTTNEYCIYNCTSLKSISLPKLKTMGNSNFQQCDKLVNIELPSLETMGSMCIYFCGSIETLDLPKVKKIGSYSVYYCTKLTKLILRSTTLCTKESNVLSNTPIASGTGYVYVPDNLVESYKSATNWSVYANQIKGISELGE